MPSALLQFVDYKAFALFRFDTDFAVTDRNGFADALIRKLDSRFGNKRLLDLFPELVGSEKQLMAVLSGEMAGFHLDFINRHDRDGTLCYLNTVVLRDDRRGTGLVIVEDVTEQARMVQQFNQQKYELVLYTSNPVFRKQWIQESILGNSPAIQEIRKTISKIGRSPGTTVLLLGESGVGKSLAAKVIHYSSMPADAPFVDINCSALPENLIEAELFGYEKGAFTHATASRPGLLEEAQGGTLLLDEIGELPLNLQAKLLSVLETKTVRRLGSNKPVSVQARIIAATNRNLAEEVAARRFREDLYYRLNVATLTLPPLRQMGEDILLIADHILKLYSLEFKRRVNGFTPAAQKKMREYAWPGNVRELSNCIERAMIFLESQWIDAKDLSILPPMAASADMRWTVPPAGIDLEEVESRLIQSALDQAQQNKTKAARLLGISRDKLRYRLEKHKPT